MTPAEEIKRAAEKLKTLTADATEGPWRSGNPNTRWGDDHGHHIVGNGKILATFSNDNNGPLNADYAAAMHPGVGALLAAWLESAEEDARQIGPDPHALALARALNPA